MGEVKELNGTKVVTKDEAQAMIDKAASDTVAQMNARNAEAAPDNLIFIRDPWERWIWQRVAVTGDMIGASVKPFDTFQAALDNFNRVCKQQIKLDVQVAPLAPVEQQVVADLAASGVVDEPPAVDAAAN